MPNSPSFGAVVRRARLAHGLSQAGLAERANLSLDAISALENGRRTLPRPTTVLLLADALALASDERANFIDAGLQRAPSAPMQQNAPAPGNLPIPATRLFGRDDQVNAVVQLIRRKEANARLVTLVGPGGVGKTRLALAIAAAVQSDFRDGVAFVDLAGVREPRELASTMARVLGVREEGAQSAQEMVLSYVRERQMLLVLDNFEQILGAATLLAEMLAGAAGLSLLVTSRAALRIRPEQRVVVHGLATPDHDSAPDDAPTDSIMRSPAVQLFVERARAVAPERDVHMRQVDTARTIAAICRRLDGLPLAIELAAARLSVLTPTALLTRLDNALSVLTAGSTDLPLRQQTMRATIEWSYALLTAADQKLLRCLAVFSGGWTLEAAEVVLESVTNAADLLDGFERLIDHSLILSTPDMDGGTRFRMLEVIHEYAHNQLSASAEAASVRHAHAAYFLELAESAHARIPGDKQAIWLTALDQDYQNVRTAASYFHSQGAAEKGQRLVGALWRYWYLRSTFAEARQQLEQQLNGELQRATRESLNALVGLAAIAYSQTDYGVAAAAAGRAIVLARDAGDRQNIAQLLVIQTGVARNQNDLGRARLVGEESVSLARDLGDNWMLALALHNVGDVLRLQGEFDLAESRAQESLELAEQVRDPWSVTQAQVVLGWIAHDRGDMTAAETWFTRSLEGARVVSNRRDLARALAGLGRLALLRGQEPRASALLDESLRIWQSLADRIRQAQVLVMLGRMEQSQTRLIEALRLYVDVDHKLGIAETLEELASLCTDMHVVVALMSQAAEIRAAIGAPLEPIEREHLEVHLARARADLGEAAFATAQALGKALSIQAAVAMVAHRSTTIPA